MAKRTGVPTMLQVSKNLCRLVVKFEPVIRATYPANNALSVALTAALTACQVLVTELDAVREIGD